MQKAPEPGGCYCQGVSPTVYCSPELTARQRSEEGSGNGLDEAPGQVPEMFTATVDSEVLF